MLVTVEELEPRALVRKVITGMEEQDLLTYRERDHGRALARLRRQ